MNHVHLFPGRPGERGPLPLEGRGPADEADPPVPVDRDARERATVAPVRLAPLLPRRGHPWLVVALDGTPGSYGALVWALREAARREAVVVAAYVLDEDGAPFDAPRHAGAADPGALVEAQVLRAVAETGVHGRVRTAVLERPVFEALTGAARGADLVVVSDQGKTLLRPVVPRSPVRRLARGA